MKRNIRLSEKWLFAGLSLVLIFMMIHDWLPLGILNDIEAIREVHSFNGLLITTLINVTQIIVLLGLVTMFMGKQYPIWIKLWLIIHQSCIFIGAFLSWWLPYFFGIGAADRAERYQQMFGNTHSFLPEMNGIVPNTIHVFFHLTLLSCIILSIYISLTDSKKKKQDHMLSENINL